MRIVSNGELPAGEATSRLGVANTAASTQAPANAAASRAAQSAVSSDTLQLSDLGTKLSAVPGVRQEKIAAVSAQVQSGTYSVSNQQIAESMIRDFRMSNAHAQ